MAILRDDDKVYFYDSHCRGPKGGTSINGTACVMSFDATYAPNNISSLVHRNVQPKSAVPNNQRGVIIEFENNVNQTTTQTLQSLVQVTAGIIRILHNANYTARYR